MIHPFKLFGMLSVALHLPILALTLAVLAATIVGPLLRAPDPVPARAVGAAPPSPFGSGAALRNLQF